MPSIPKIVVGGAGGLAAYLLWVRPWHLRWGATAEEVKSTMPGDRIVIDLTFNTTRGVTISAKPKQYDPGCFNWGVSGLGFIVTTGLIMPVFPAQNLFCLNFNR